MLSERLRQLRRVTVVASVAALAAAGGGAIADASTPPPSGSVTVPQGTSAADLPSAQQQSATDPNTPMQVSFILKARNKSALERKAQAGWGDNYLTTAQFANTYGQTPAVVNGIVKYLKGYGITSTVYPDRLDISTTGTAGEYNKALSVGLNNYQVNESNPNGKRGTHTATVHGTKKDPQMPASKSGQDLGKAVLAILGLSNYSPFASNAVEAQGTKNRVTGKANGSLPPGTLAPSAYASRYNLTGLYNQGAKGQGRTIGIVTLASFTPSTAVAFWNNYLGLNESASRITVVPIDGGSGPVSAQAGSDETDLDVEQSGALAPKANLRVYEAPNTDPGFADAFYKAASDNVADSVSASWGESETAVQAAVASGTETPAYIAAFDQAFLEYAAQGQSSFASAGDDGAYDAQADAMTTNLAVDTPADSPYITSAGGTTLPGTQSYAVAGSKGVTESANIPSEISWSWDYLWPLYKALGEPSASAAASANAAGGGGGYSVAEPRPSYQKNISDFQFTPYLTPTTPESIAPGVTEPTQFQYTAVPSTGSSSTPTGRGESDVSANADPQTGYAVYDPVVFASTGGFAQYGGTSFVAPQLNGSTAVIDSALGKRVGFWNPQVYSYAQRGNSPFTPINDTQLYSGAKYLYQTDAKGNVTALPGSFSNNNLYYTGNPGSYWNPASGLGTPNLTKLARDFG